jgi:hypothetical protein
LAKRRKKKKKNTSVSSLSDRCLKGTFEHVANPACVNYP